MLIVYIYCRKINVIFQKILSILEDHQPQQLRDIVLFPPDDLGNVSDEDSANEDDGMKNVNQLGKEFLSQKGELVPDYNEDKLDENDVYGDQESHGIVGVAADPQPGPFGANPLRSNTRERKEGCSTQKSGRRPNLGGSHTVDKDALQNKPAKQKFTEFLIAAGQDKPLQKKEKRRPRKKLVFSISSASEDEDEENNKLPLPRIKNKDRLQSKDRNQLGKSISSFPEAAKFSLENLPIDPETVKTPYDYMKLFISDKFVHKVVKETKRFAAKQNHLSFQSNVDESLIRASHAIMFMTGYLKPSNRRMYWKRRDDTSNIMAKIAMPRNTFDEAMRFIHFSNSDHPKDDPF